MWTPPLRHLATHCMGSYYKANAPLSKLIGTVVGSYPPLLTELVTIFFSSVGRAVACVRLYGSTLNFDLSPLMWNNALAFGFKQP